MDRGKACGAVVVISEGNELAVHRMEAQTGLLLIGQRQPGRVDQQVEGVYLLDHDAVLVDLKGLDLIVHPQEDVVGRHIDPALAAYIAHRTVRLLIAHDHAVQA